LSIPARITRLREYLRNFKPPIVITFSAEAFVFAMRAMHDDAAGIPAHPKVADLGRSFRDAIRNYDPELVNVFPLLHAYAARGHWHTLGPVFSGSDDPDINYFEYAGRALGDVLLKHGRDLAIWCSAE